MVFNKERRSSSSSTLQQRLSSESVGNMEVCCGDETCERNDHVGLSFGPYGASPLRGLHFDTAEDTAAS